MSKLNVGDPVLVNDPGLAMIRKFAPPGAEPNNHGVVHEILDDGDIMVAFPVHGEVEHSQVAPYPASMVIRR